MALPANGQVYRSAQVQGKFTAEQEWFWVPLGGQNDWLDCEERCTLYQTAEPHWRWKIIRTVLLPGQVRVMAEKTSERTLSVEVTGRIE